MELLWNFYRIYLRQSDLEPEEREAILTNRFQNADTWIHRYAREGKRREYRYQLADVDELRTEDGRQIIFGKMTRHPKHAHGLSVNEHTKRSKNASVDVEELYDGTEFIYDLRDCVLMLHRRTPFCPTRTTVKAWANLLGVPVQDSRKTDVYVELLRESSYVEDQLDGDEPLTYVRLKYVRCNPGVDEDLGRWAEAVGADEASTEWRTHTGSLDKSQDGVIRRSIRSLLEKGYLQLAKLRLGGREINVVKAAEKACRKGTYLKDAEGNPLSLKELSRRWFAEVRDWASDIFRENM